VRQLGRRSVVSGYHVDVTRSDAADAVVDGLEAGQELLDAKGAERAAAFEIGDVQGHRGWP
jgi:hypothetical protein